MNVAFQSTDFIFCFLPISILLFYLVKQKYRQYLLIIVDIVFLFLFRWELAVLLLVSTVFNILIIKNLNRKEKNERKVLISGILWNIFVFVEGKIVFPLYGLEILGVSYYSFKALSLLLDIYRNKESVPTMKAISYLLLFPQIIVGPIDIYSFQERRKREQITDLANGLQRFVLGLSQKVILADSLAKIVSEIFDNYSKASAIYCWLGALVFCLQLYYDFKGCSDMAIGLCLVFGVSSVENFNEPYSSKTVTEFWHRWHMSLGNWFKEYLYIPLGGSRNGMGRTIINLLIVWLATSIWHGITWKFVAWGMMNFLMITLEKMFVSRAIIKNRFFSVIYRLIVFLFIVFQWTMFRADTIQVAVSYYGGMFGMNHNALTDGRALILVKDYWFFLLTGIVFVIPWKLLIKQNNKINVMSGYVGNIITWTLFILSISFVISGNNNPFIYSLF